MGAGWCRAAAGFLLLALAVAGRPVDLADSQAVVVPAFSSLDMPPPRNDSSTALVTRGDDAPVELRLCECERATGAPSGLSCDKAGWFISSWERQGQWVAGGGYVPLSHAICCRPCLPAELPPDASGRIPAGEAPLAVISLGCHASTDSSLSARCEANAGSFVSGYSEAVKVFTTPDTFYPINTVQCCTPALLLPSGDAWELERCGCHDSRDPDFPVNCGGTHTDELLLGYVFYRLSPLGHVVPVGPAQCCKVCLSGTVHPMNQCDDLNACSGRGVCNMRRCECFEGWTGPDCGTAARNGRSIPPWAIALIVLSSSALAGIFIIAAGYALQALGLSPGTPAGSEDGDGDERQPLLIRLDADDGGSVGSADTTGEQLLARHAPADCLDAEEGEEAEEAERRVTRAIARLEHAVAEAEGRPPAADATAAAAAEGGGAEAADGGGAEPGSPGSPPAAAEEQREGNGNGEAADAAAQPTAAEAQREGNGNGEAADAAAQPAAAHPAVAADEAPPPAAAEEAASVGIAEPRKRNRCGPTPEGPLAMVDCSVCMTRPVQVVVVPCGHVCMCRRCSRRLQRCPMCRKEIARRQRLFV